VLLTAWPSVPIEVAPIAAPTVLMKLRHMGSVDPRVRLNPLSKSGPLRTDQGFYIVDAPFPGRLKKPGDVDDLAQEINEIVGVLEVGFFNRLDPYEVAAHPGLQTQEVGDKPVAAYFGMKDGTVQVRVSQYFQSSHDFR
jgi:ribose 5-phosphate isomerase A